MIFILLERLPCKANDMESEARVGKIFGKRFLINMVICETVKADELTWQRAGTEPWRHARMLGVMELLLAVEVY